MLRMNTPSSAACVCIRRRSPSTAPPLNGLVGSTAITPTVGKSATGSADDDGRPSGTRWFGSGDETIDERALAGARRTGDADE